MTAVAPRPGTVPPPPPGAPGGVAWLRRTAGALHAVVDELLVSELREGLVRLHGLPVGLRAAVRAGFALVVVAVLAILFSGTVRGVGDLLDVPFSSDPGMLVPSAAVPLVMLLFTVAWGLLLAGAVHAHAVLRVVVWVVFACTTLSLDVAASLGTRSAVVPLVVVGAAAVALAAGRWLRTRPTLALLATMTLSAVHHLNVQAGLAELLVGTASPVPLQALAVQLGLLQLLILPLLVVLGLDFADFAFRASRLVIASTSAVVPGLLLGVLAAVFLAWSVWGAAAQVLSHLAEDGVAALGGYLGAGVVPLLGAAVWWLVHRRAGAQDADEVADEAGGVGWLVVGGLYGWQLLAVGVLLLLSGLGPLVDAGVATELSARALDLLSQVEVLARWWVVVVEVVLGVVALRLARRGRRGVALFLGTLAAVGLWLDLLGAAPLAALRPLDGAESAWWVAAATATAMVLAVRRVRGAQVGEPQVAVVVLVLAITVMARQIDLLDDPWSTVFVFGGVAAVAFGVLWDACTVGRWANEGSAWLPRPARVLCYLGYVLFGVAIISWAVTTQDAGLLDDLTGGISARGYDVVGRPLLVAVRVLLLASVLRRPPLVLPTPPSSEDAVPPSPATSP